MKAEKSRTNEYHKKDKFSYAEANNYLSDIDDICVEESEVNMIELKPKPPYVCKLLKLSNNKSHVEPIKNDKFVAKTYTFDISKCDEIFNLLVTYGQIIVPRQRTFYPSANIPKDKWAKPLNQKGANQSKWKEIEPKVGIPYQRNQKVSKGKSHIFPQPTK